MIPERIVTYLVAAALSIPIYWAVADSALILPTQARGAALDDGKTLRPKMSFHGVSPRLDYLARHPTPVASGDGQAIEAERELPDEQRAPSASGESLAQPFVQTTTPTPAAVVAGANFEGPGSGMAGFVLNTVPSDATMGVGPDHILAWVNSMFVVLDKSGTVMMPPVNGNSLFTGMPNLCATTNRGDPLVQYDRLADRWILSQWAFAVNGSGVPIAPYLQCFAVSTTGDPMGTYARYVVQFSAVAPSGLHDYGKLGVWPDAYYTSHNMFGGSPAGASTCAGLCASDRVKMLAGDPTATMLCAPIAFYGGGAAFLPADLDGTTLPSDLSQGGVFMRVSTAPALRILKLKPDFSAGTVTLSDGFGGAPGTFVNLPLPATISACNGAGGACIPQPGTGNVLDTFGGRLMYRLAFRNRAGVESMVATHTVDPDGGGTRDATLRWYEIRNPLGDPADPVVANRPVIFQNGTYDPGTSGDRWMGSIAMDGAGNIMLGYSVVNAGSGLFPSIGIAAREAADPLNTLQAEIIAHTGTGSQTTFTRWGDYSTMQVDPSDDRTFWYINQYLSDNSFNWRTRIVSFQFPPDNIFASGFE